jgi:hypothetical protein
VDFEFFDLKPVDFHGLRALFQRYLDGELPFALSELVETLIQQACATRAMLRRAPLTRAALAAGQLGWLRGQGKRRRGPAGRDERLGAGHAPQAPGGAAGAGCGACLRTAFTPHALWS